MSRRSSSSAWTEVDRSADPGALVDYLDAVSGLEAVQAYKRQTYALLGVRPGDRVLDVGCGAGDDVRALARIVAPGGSVVGVDVSATMVDQARRRSDGLALPLEFRTGNVHRLDFADGEFDAARADRVFQHLEDPNRALAELIRVTRPGGRILAVDPDWGSLIVDAPDPRTTRAALDEIAGAIRNPWMGRQLFGLFHRVGLEEVSAVGGAAVFTDYAQADHQLRLGEGIAGAKTSGTVTKAAAANWTRALALDEAAVAGRFCAALAAIIVVGRRP